MATKANKKTSQARGLLDPQELEAVVQDLAESFRRARSIEDRRELVLRLRRRGMRPGEIARYICGPFRIKRATVNSDLAWAKDFELKWAKNRNLDEAMSEALGVNQEIKRQAFAKGDLQTANQANIHFARLRKLTEEGITLNVPETEKTSDQRREAIAAKLARLTQPEPKK